MTEQSTMKSLEQDMMKSLEQDVINNDQLSTKSKSTVSTVMKGTGTVMLGASIIVGGVVYTASSLMESHKEGSVNEKASKFISETGKIILTGIKKKFNIE